MSHTNAYSGRRTPEGEEAQPQRSEQQEWTPKFVGGDAWRIGGSPCSYGYSKQQATEICNAHNTALAAERDRGHRNWDSDAIANERRSLDLGSLANICRGEKSEVLTEDGREILKAFADEHEKIAELYMTIGVTGIKGEPSAIEMVKNLYRELDAERQRCEQVEERARAWQECSFEHAAGTITKLKAKLLSAQAAISQVVAETQPQLNTKPFSEICIEVYDLLRGFDLYLLYQHDDEVRKPLMEALLDAGCRLRELTRSYEERWGKTHTKDFHDLIERIDALSKEGK